MKSYFVLAVIAALAPHAAAQQQPQANPADAAATVPASRYESAFTGYRGFREEPIAPWPSVNDEVARVGGHVGILKGASGASGKGATPQTPPPPAAPGPGANPPAAGAKGAGHAR